MIEMITRTLSRIALGFSSWFGGTWIRSMMKGIAGELARVSDMRDSVYCAVVPSTNLCPESIFDLEGKYGIDHNDDLTDKQRIARILDRASMNGAGGPKWLENVIQTAGFPLYVVENTPAADIRIPRPDALYRFQTVPDFPDNVAGTLYKSNFTTSDGWAATNGNITVANGILRCTATADGMVLYRDVSWGTKLVRLRIRNSKTSGFTVYGTDGSQPIGRIATMTIGDWTYFDAYNANATSTQIRIAPNGSEAVGDWIELSLAYIGSGLYDTLVPDDSGHGNDLVNHGVLPVYDATLGRDVMSFNGTQYLQANNPVIGTSGTIAFKFKAGLLSTAQRLICTRPSSGYGGCAILLESSNKISFEICSDSAMQTILSTSTIVNTTDYNDFVVSITGTTVTIYINGLLDKSTSLTLTPSIVSIVNLMVGVFTAGYQYFTGSISDILYDSRIWTQADVDWYKTHGGLISNAGYTQFGDIQFDQTTQFATMPSRVDPSTVSGVLITSSANRRGGARVASSSQFGSGQFGSSQFGSPDQSKSYPQPAIRNLPTDPTTWGRVFFLSPIEGRLATRDELLIISEEEQRYLIRLIEQVKFLRNWCVLQVGQNVQRSTDDGSVRVLEDGTTIRRI